MSDNPADDQNAQEAVLNRIKSGAPIPASNAAMIERWWEVASEFPRERRGHVAIGLETIAGPNAVPLGPEQFLGLTMRVAILSGLEERGLLRRYLAKGELRKKLFASIATMALTIEDFGEAVVERLLRESAPEEVAKLRQQMAAQGLDVDRPRVMARLDAEIHGTTP